MIDNCTYPDTLIKADLSPCFKTEEITIMVFWIEVFYQLHPKFLRGYYRSKLCPLSNQNSLNFCVVLEKAIGPQMICFESFKNVVEELTSQASWDGSNEHST